MAIRIDGAALSWHAARLAAKLPGVSLHRYVLTAVPVAGMPAMPRGFEAASPSRDEVVACGLVTRRAAAWRESQGMECVGARRGGALVGVTWLVAGRFDEDEAWLTFVPPPGAAWDTGLVIAPGARASRAFAALWAATRQSMERAGLRWSISRIADYNLGSRRAHMRMRGEEIGRVSVLRLGGMQLASGARPIVTRTGGARALVRLRLPA